MLSTAEGPRPFQPRNPPTATLTPGVGAAAGRGVGGVGFLEFGGPSGRSDGRARSGGGARSGHYGPHSLSGNKEKACGFMKRQTTA